jgi:peptidyl-Lys metalloendopeptidase
MSFHSRLYRVLTTGSFLSLVALAVAHATEPLPLGLTVRLEAQHPGFGTNEPSTLLYTLRNDSPEDVFVLYWQTPLRGIFGDLFDVRLDGQAVSYLGPIIEWATPQERDFILIPSGGELSTSLDLSAAYKISRSGEYWVKYRAPQNMNPLNKEAARLESNAVTFWVEAPRGPTMPNFEAEELAQGSPVFKPIVPSCSNERQAQIRAMFEKAKSITRSALNRLNAGTMEAGYTDKDYRTWFGCYDEKRYETVKRNFSKVLDALSSKTFAFLCEECKVTYPDAIAYVFPNQPYIVHLCNNRFWNRPLSDNLNSRAGSLVHEVSHFAVVANTEDFTIGADSSSVREAQRLAKTQEGPIYAVKNAHSYQYFAESPHSDRNVPTSPKITNAEVPILRGDLTPGTLVLRFTNDDCDPIVRVESRTVSSPGNWRSGDTVNPTLLEGTWRDGSVGVMFYCKVVGDRDLGPHVMDQVLVDALGQRSKSFRTRFFCTYP